MKSYSWFTFSAVSLLAFISTALPADNPVISFVYETPHEFFGSGDFDGDGRSDVVIVDKETGKFRLGYQTAPGTLTWEDCRASMIKALTGFTVGPLVTKNHDGFAFTGPDANQITIVAASMPTTPEKPLTAPFTAALGSSTVVAVDGGSMAKTGLLDLYVGSIYNSPDANMVTLLRNDGAQLPKISEAALAGPAVRGNRLSLKAGSPELLCVLINEDKSSSLHVENFSSGKQVAVLTVPNLPAGADYAVGNFRGQPLREFLFYQPGQSSITVRPVEEAGGQFQVGQGASFDLGQPVRRLVTLTQSSGQKLFVIFGEGEKAGVYAFDGVKAPVAVQTLNGTNELFTSAASLPDGFVAFSQPAGGKFSTKYYAYKASGSTFAATAFGTLPTLADNDNITIPDIYARIVAQQKVTSQSDMKLYTNTIPGTRVSYVMVPIPGGEFVMGSPDSEPNRKPDEGPQHKVKISPFWMGQCEITWNEYELFMYPDQEKQTRANNPTDTAGDKLGDAVTHPSKPYVEMSFGMGKDGYPAIAMTQHAANKYCQWLSAKTGQFYRLPTEAEWEYACRAGTTTTYYWGDDPSQLKDNAWYEENSDFKYQKVGKKKPNPWGLYDMYGNVVEYVLDQYDPNYYQQCAGKGVITDPWNKATKPYPHSVRGGSWDDPADRCRSAARRGSERAWKMTDPQLPKSIWYFSDAQWVGFRIIRPLKVPTAEEMQKYWSSGVERD